MAVVQLAEEPKTVVERVKHESGVKHQEPPCSVQMGWSFQTPI